MSYLRRAIPALLVAFALAGVALVSPGLWPLAGEPSIDISVFPEESLDVAPVVVAALPPVGTPADAPDDATRIVVTIPITVVPDWPEPDMAVDLDPSRVAPPPVAQPPAPPPPRRAKPRPPRSMQPAVFAPPPAPPQPAPWSPRHPRPDPVGLPPPWAARVFEF